ncbi:hypothetical protein [uncultured Sphingorhabdus sp.]|uniref:hypothetical protein n=1 Tax=uncultured Sphingorhabdus sp. TaxID=1686106 RepID=UPI00261962FE|nr:hypothetical protein [uncultured Sphingorhabdus sp.]
MAAAALPIVALGMQVAGTVAGGIAENKQQRAAARVDDENARLTVLQGEQEALDTRREERSMAGDMIAAMAGSGTMLDGSNADLITQSAYQRELEIYNIRRQRTSQARNLQQSAKDKRRAGRNALIGAGFSAVSTALGGIADIRAGRLMAAQGARERGATLTGSIKLPSRSSAATGAPAPYQLGYNGVMSRTPR